MAVCHLLFLDLMLLYPQLLVDAEHQQEQGVWVDVIDGVEGASFAFLTLANAIKQAPALKGWRWTVQRIQYVETVDEPFHFYQYREHQYRTRAYAETEKHSEEHEWLDCCVDDKFHGCTV